ncbi:MAG: amidase, partial [Acutalibacteraceae bacterium]
MDILKMTALEVGAAIKAKELSAVEAAKAVIAAAKHKDDKIGAYITLCEEKAVEDAAAVQEKIDSGAITSPLAGVPFSIKDNICTKGIKTSCASKILGDFAPVYNATVIERLEAAGAVTVGKLNMDEFAMGSTTETSYYGATKNPWNTAHVPGGSSGGAAAAVAAGEAVCALGSDTGGSIRQPASYCGVTGFKPTYGTVSRFGLIAYASSLDQIGPVARDVRDCAAVMNAICGKDAADGTSLDIAYPDYLAALSGNVKGMKIGLPKECFKNKGLDSEVAARVLDAAKVLEANGAIIEEISLPFIDYVIPAYYII